MKGITFFNQFSILAVEDYAKVSPNFAFTKLLLGNITWKY